MNFLRIFCLSGQPGWLIRSMVVFTDRSTGDGRIIPDAVKGGILNARILWTFSAAYHQEKNPLYLEMAKRAKDFILSHFFDPEFGGTYWTISFDGKPVDTKKQIYSQAFFIYAFTEYYRASGDESSPSDGY